MLRQNEAPPQLTGMEPVSLLIEMGIEKLKRDYLYIFTSGMDSLDIFLLFITLNNN